MKFIHRFIIYIQNFNFKNLFRRKNFSNQSRHTFFDPNEAQLTYNTITNAFAVLSYLILILTISYCLRSNIRDYICRHMSNHNED